MRTLIVTLTAIAVACAGADSTPQAPVTPAQPAVATAQAAPLAAEPPPAEVDRYVCPMCAGVESDHPGTCPHCGMALVKEDEAAAPEAPVYTCPMHPEVHQLGPGACPTCGMDLVPATEPAAGHDHHHP